MNPSRCLKDVLRRLLATHGYELYRRPWLPKGVDPWETLHEIFPAWRPALIFDVGANVGEVALHLATHFPTAEIHAFEPIGTTAQSLRERVRPCPRIHPYQLALGDSNTRVSVHPQSESTLNSLRDARSPSIHSVPSAETIEVVTLDSFCATHDIRHIDILKTDTEGFELSVLAGATRMLDAGAIDAVLVEAGLVSGDPRFVPLTSISGVLQPHGFILIGIFDQHGWRHRLGAEFCNALFVRSALLPA